MTTQRLSDRGVVPAGGFRYLQQDTNTWVRASSWVELLRNVRAHREANNIPCGTGLEEEVETQLCSFLPPGQCTYGNESERRRASLVARPTWEKFKEATKVAARALRDGRATPGEADEHAVVCSKCAFNQPPEAGCTSCKGSELANMLAEYSLAPTIKHGNLHACLLCGCGLRAKVHLKAETARKVAEEGGYLELLPEWCWIRKLD